MVTLATQMRRYVENVELHLAIKHSKANFNLQRLRFTNAMWDECTRLNTVSPAGQLEAAEDDTLPAVPELKMPPRHVKKYNLFSSKPCE